MSYQRVATNIESFQIWMWDKVKEIIRYRSNELLAYTTMRFLSRKGSITVGSRTGALARGGSVREPYRVGLRVFGGIKFVARNPVTGYNYAFSHFRNPGDSHTVVIRPRKGQALAIPIEGAGSTYGGTTFARGNLLFVRNSSDPYDLTPVAVLARSVTYPRRIDVEGQLWSYIRPKIQADLAHMAATFRPPA